MSVDTYTPPPAQAICPYCGTAVAGAPATPAVYCAILFWTCPACHQDWTEYRGRGEYRRAWTPAPGAAAC